MNIADAAIRKKTSALVVVVLILVGGLMAYRSLGRLEDPEFTIKDAKVITLYPGASAREVADEVTDVIEKALQRLGQVKEVTSTSTPGRSIVTVTAKDRYDKTGLPQVWDEVRRKVHDAQGRLPPGAGPSTVIDDFGDVYGIYFAITGDGYSYADLKEHAKMLQRELLLCTDVAKVELQGLQQEVIFVEITRASLAQLGVSEDRIYQLLQGKNLVTPSGQVAVGREYMRIVPTGDLDSVEAIGGLVIEGLGTDSIVRLRDVATITRDFQDPPATLVRIDGKPAIGIGISTVAGGNVVTMGGSVAARLAELDADTPIGIERGEIYQQPELVTKAVGSFVINLIEAIALVIGVLLLAMGLRSGLLIGAILLLTILATLIVMQVSGIAMDRVSLGALIIALGMLVDNAIVVTEGILIGLQRGRKVTEVAVEVVKKTMWPLLGATLVAILAFAAIGLSQDQTGEYCRSLFKVILYSLGLSWVLAVTITPLFCIMFLKPGKMKGDAYDGKFFGGYRRFLHACLRHRWMTLGLMVVLLVFAVKSFAFVDKSFFPESTTPQFTVDYWTTEGTDIRETEKDLASIEEHVLGLEGVESVFSLVGQGALRFRLTYAPEEPNTAFGQLIVKTDSLERMRDLMPRIEGHIRANHPEALTYSNPFVVGPGGGSDVELRILGPDPAVLRKLSTQAQEIFREDPDSRDIRDDWREKVKVLRPRLTEPQASNASLTRAAVGNALQRNFGGRPVGLYREADELIPIVARAPAPERLDVDTIRDMRIWSPAAQSTIPLRQVVSSFRTEWEDHIIRRRDRRLTITPQCNADRGVPTRLFERIRPRIESELKLPPDYAMEWGGEYEDSSDAEAALGSKLPVTLLLMVLVVIFLFDSLKQPAIIWLTVPLAMIGVSAGLLATGQSFGFMAILGLLSLIGMLIKNAVVLVDETDRQIREGRPPLRAVIDAGVSRLRPVSMAAATTVLGMIPLLQDVFFSSMAVTIMAGLTFATVLTLLVIPVLYVAVFRIDWDEEVAQAAE
jgi:multidrug efflux pump subunit AcrB